MTIEEFHFKWRGEAIERKIGEVYKKEGKKIKCIESKSKNTCINCIYDVRRCSKDENIDGPCHKGDRFDKTYVKFVEVKMKKKFRKNNVFSYDGEYWNDENHFRKELALEYAKKHWREYNHESDLTDGYLEIYIGEAEYYKDRIDADDIIERLQENAWDKIGEYSETYLDDITKEQMGILEERLNKVWVEFKKEFGISENLYTIVNEKKYEFNIYSEDFKEYLGEEN